MRTKTYCGRTLQQVFADIEAETHDRGWRTSVLKIEHGSAGGFFGLFGRGKVSVTVALEEENPGEAVPLPVAPAVVGTAQAAHRAAPHPRPKTSRPRKRACIRRLTRVKVPSAAGHDAGSQPAKTAIPAILLRMRQQLLNQDVEPRHADRLVSAVAAETGSKAEKNPELALAAMERHIARRLPSSGPLTCIPNGLRVAVFTGPTGVGKTTTIAKLAARLCFSEKKRIALVTMDTFRVAATDQLRTYARILDVSCETATTPEELRVAVHRHADKDVVLVDTAGQSPSNSLRIAELRDFLAPIRPVETYLLMNAGMRIQDAEMCMESFGAISPDRLIFTKLDETSCYGLIFEVSQRFRLPIAYLTTGQNVPQDIQTADSRTMARLLLGAGGESPA